MRLNTISPADGSKPTPKRVGRGEGSGIGKTCGRGQKGQKSRSGGYHKSGFEGGQMPLQRRLPKVGFRSRQTRFNDEIRLHELQSLAASGVSDIDMAALRTARMIDKLVKTVKVISSGELTSAVNVSGLKVTKGARAAIEAAGGKVA